MAHEKLRYYWKNQIENDSPYVVDTAATDIKKKVMHCKTDAEAERLASRLNILDLQWSNDTLRDTTTAQAATIKRLKEELDGLQDLVT